MLDVQHSPSYQNVELLNLKSHNLHNYFISLNGKNIIVAIEDINIRNLTNNLTLDLYIREINPSLNTKDEYRSRTLTLKF